MSTTPVKFTDLGLSDSMLNSLNKKGFEEPSPIQAKAIPFLLKDERDLIGKAQTGTGKTAAFGIPLIESLDTSAKHVKAIILAPTRELAIQVAEELASFANDKKISIIPIYGGQPIERQISRLKRGVDIVVGTPGRVMDHLDRKTLNISKVSQIILDEADEMLNMGFIEDIETILQQAPEDRKTVLFSATMPNHIERLAKKYMKDYETISVITKNTNRDNIEQIYFEVAQSDKFEALFRIIEFEESFYGLIFCRTKIDADDISSKLSNRGCRAESLHGDVSQAQREKILKKFRDKKLSVLVATDVAARGIDVDNLTHVINYSLPQDPESYVHRIGRTGRAGKSGTAITLITPYENRKLVTIQRMANTKIVKQDIPNVKDLISNKKARIKSTISKIIAEGNFCDLEETAEEILSTLGQDNEVSDPKVVVASLLKLSFKDELSEDSYSHINTASRRQRDNNDRGSDRRGGGSNSTRLFIAKGRNDRMDPRLLVDFIQKETGLDQRNINDVQMFDDFSFFAVAPGDADQVIKQFQKSSKSGRSLVSRAKERQGGGHRGGNRGGHRGGGHRGGGYRGGNKGFRN